MPKVEFKKSKTLLNLARSFAGECMEGARYQFLAQMCMSENLQFLQTILKGIARNEMAHAKIFYNHITKNNSLAFEDIQINAGYPFKCGDITQQFANAASYEKNESENLYPSFAETAKREGFLDIAESFMLIAGAENNHRILLENISSKLKNNKLYKRARPIKWKCFTCGHELISKTPWQACPLCSAGQGFTELPQSDMTD